MMIVSLQRLQLLDLAIRWSVLVLFLTTTIRCCCCCHGWKTTTTMLTTTTTQRRFASPSHSKTKLSNKMRQQQHQLLLTMRSGSVTPSDTTTTPPTSSTTPTQLAATSTTSLSSSTSSSSIPSSSTWWSRATSWIRRRGQPRTDEELKLGIAGFYDRSSKLWEDVWGEHMHHGYYVPANRTDHVQAQIDLIDQVLLWAHVINGSTTSSSSGSAITATSSSPPRRVVDVGCGIGGSSRHMARLFQQQQQQQSQSGIPATTFQGITLSPYQAQRANELAQQQGLASTCTFQVADAMKMPFADDTFDLVWSLESGEHMPNKPQFCQELMRVCAPGGRILLVTWCHRDIVGNDQKATTLEPWEERLLERINRAYYLPKWCSVQDYVDMFQALGATDIQRDDWSYIIAPFWKAVLRSALNWKSVVGLLRSGWTTQRGAVAMLLMLRGYQRGLIKFGLITCIKPLPPPPPQNQQQQENVDNVDVKVDVNVDDNDEKVNDQVNEKE